jgi:ketosteroid isomerase-like protein
MVACVPGARQNSAAIGGRLGIAPADAAGELMAAEHAYAAASTESEGWAIVDRMFADDIVLFAPPVPGFAIGRDAGIDALEQATATSVGEVGWRPLRVGVSADGEHGFSFGYLTIRRTTEAEFHAKYVAYWRRQAGVWRVALYKLIPSEEPPRSFEMMAPFIPGLALAAGRSAEIAAYEESLARREQQFSDDSQRLGLGAAFAQYGRTDAVNVGGGPDFVVGATAIGASQGDGPGSPFTWSADGGVLVASSGDLGVTWGFLRRNQPPPPGRLAEIPFFTVWYRQSPQADWLYVAE